MCPTGIKHTVRPTCDKGGNLKTISLDTSLLQSDTVTYLWSGQQLQICYPETQPNGTIKSIYLAIQTNAFYQQRSFDIDRTKTPVIYFNCKNIQHLRIQTPKIDLVQNEILFAPVYPSGSVLPYWQSFWIPDISCDGTITVETYSHGKKIETTYTNLNHATITGATEFPYGIRIKGDVLRLSLYRQQPSDTPTRFGSILFNTAYLAQLELDECCRFAKLDLSTARNLRTIGLHTENILQELNISNSLQMFSPALDGAPNLKKLLVSLKDSQAASYIAGYITRHPGSDRTVYCRPTDTYYSVVETAAQNSEWNIEHI